MQKFNIHFERQKKRTIPKTEMLNERLQTQCKLNKKKHTHSFWCIKKRCKHENV